MKRAVLLLPMLALTAGCQQPPEQSDTQIEHHIDIGTQADNAAFQSTYELQRTDERPFT
jgi:hypothetical protein